MDPLPIFGTLGVFAIVMAVPITAILTRHQRMMATIIHGNRQAGIDESSVARLSQEIAELRHLVAQQTILLDDLNTLNRRLLERSASDDAVRNRLNG